MRRRVGFVIRSSVSHAWRYTPGGDNRYIAVIPTDPAWLVPYGEPSARLIGEALRSTFAWDRLAVLTDTIGHRLSGTPALERAIQWAVAEMNRDGLENVHTERVMVPKWVRGNESAEIVEPARHAIVMLGLGDSVGTPADGVQAEVLVVRSFEELDTQGRRARGASSSSTSRSRTTARPCGFAPPGRRAPRATAPSPSLVRAGRTGRAAHAAHRRAAVRRRRAEDPGGGGHRRRRRPPAAHGRPRQPASSSRLKMEAHFEAGRRVGERRRRDPRPRAAGRESWSSAATSTRGTSAPARPTMAAAAS